MWLYAATVGDVKGDCTGATFFRLSRSAGSSGVVLRMMSCSGASNCSDCAGPTIGRSSKYDASMAVNSSVGEETKSPSSTIVSIGAAAWRASTDEILFSCERALIDLRKELARLKNFGVSLFISGFPVDGAFLDETRRDNEGMRLTNRAARLWFASLTIGGSSDFLRSGTWSSLAT